MERLNRDLQRNLLEQLAGAYPKGLAATDLGFKPKDPNWTVNIEYLGEHGLVDVARFAGATTGSSAPESARITARGLDFITDDGGLSAILGVVTVRFDADTLRAFIGNHIDSSKLPAEEKSRIKRWLETAGAEALKETTKRLAGAAIEHAPQAIELLRQLAG